ncbi:MAG: phosphatase PAP2 family protein [Bacteroidales bacterium]|jgi:undecaprenyl-diphosphatase|nr:phosphatase PAP2 family protein [Bacteroidales bacterium]
MLETLELVDRNILLAINAANASWADTLFWYISKPWASIPLYVATIYILYKKFRAKQASMYLLCIVLSIALADLISVHAFKNVFMRYRPTHNVEIADMIHIVNGYRGGMYGFVSSHAANMWAFCIAAILCVRNRTFTIISIIWAALVCYSRMYLGVHYPADIIGGALLGAAIAFLISKLVDKFTSGRVNKLIRQQ